MKLHNPFDEAKAGRKYPPKKWPESQNILHSINKSFIKSGLQEEKPLSKHYFLCKPARENLQIFRIADKGAESEAWCSSR